MPTLAGSRRRSLFPLVLFVSHGVVQREVRIHLWPCASPAALPTSHLQPHTGPLLPRTTLRSDAALLTTHRSAAHQSAAHQSAAHQSAERRPPPNSKQPAAPYRPPQSAKQPPADPIQIRIYTATWNLGLELPDHNLDALVPRGGSEFDLIAIGVQEGATAPHHPPLITHPSSAESPPLRMCHQPPATINLAAGRFFTIASAAETSAAETGDAA